MAVVPITTQVVVPAGLAPTLSAELNSVDTQQVVNDGHTFLRLVNSGVARTVTFIVPRRTDPVQRKARWPLDAVNPVRTLSAFDGGSGSGNEDDTGGELLVGPFPKDIFGDVLTFSVSGAGVRAQALRFETHGRGTSGSSGWEPASYS